MFYEKMLKENEKLDNQIHTLQSQLKTLPDGKLVCASNGKWKKWYHSTKQGTMYLPKKNRKLAEDLAYKKYVQLQLENLNCEKEAINSYLNHHDSNARQKEEELFYSPDFHSLLQARLTPLSEELQTWMTMPYDKNANHPENLNNKAYSGNMVRSKSEVLIDMFLFKNKIPFRYECLLELDGIMMYPDFTIRHPKTGETFYWEHFGLMDNPTYSKNACSKLQHYISSGIIPSIQLITTYETKDNPLSAEKVEKIVEEYFL